MAKATPVTTSSSDLHDEPRQFDALTFLRDPLGKIEFTNQVWEEFERLKCTMTEVRYLRLTDFFVRMGGGKGCWASVHYMAGLLRMSERTVQLVRQKLLRKKLLIAAGQIDVRGLPRPVFHTVLRPPNTRGATPCAPRFGRKELRPISKKKTKDKIHTIPAAGGDLNKGKSMPFIINENQTSPVHEELARALHQKWKDSPPRDRQGRGIAKSTTPQVWADLVRRLIRANWSGGETAVASLFERVIKVWDALDPDVRPTPKKLYGSGDGGNANYLKYVLLPAVERAEAAAPVQLTGAELRDWRYLKDEGWPGDVKQARLAFARTRSVFDKLTKALGRLKANCTGMEQKAGGLWGWKKGTPLDRNGAALLAKLSMTPVQFFRKAADFAKYVHEQHKKTPDYQSAAYTLKPAELLAHKVFAPIIHAAVPNAKEQQDLLSYLKVEVTG